MFLYKQDVNAEGNNEQWCLFFFLSPRSIRGIFRRLTTYYTMLFLFVLLSNFVLFLWKCIQYVYCYSVEHVNKMISLSFYSKTFSFVYFGVIKMHIKHFRISPVFQCLEKHLIGRTKVPLTELN